MASPHTNPRERSAWQKFFTSLPRNGKMHLLAGVFCIFASFSLVYNLASGRDLPLHQVLLWTAFSGFTAVGWVLAASYTWKVLFAVVPLSFLLPSLWGHEFWLPGRILSGTAPELLLFLAMLILGYVLVISFIGGEGAKSLRHRAEIALARDIHQRLVPPVALTAGRYQLYGSSDSATEVGGDLLDIVGTKGTRGLYIADVTGHGVPAGVMMSMIKSAVRMRKRTTVSLTDLMSDLNEVLLEVQKPGMFATFAGVELNEGVSVEFCLAGHPPLLHYRAASRSIERHEASGPPLGVVPGFAFRAARIEVARGDLLAILTDGLIEVFDARGEDFGEARFIEALAANAERPLAETHAALLAEVRRFGAQDDDQTLLLVRVVG